MLTTHSLSESSNLDGFSFSDLTGPAPAVTPLKFIEPAEALILFVSEAPHSSRKLIREPLASGDERLVEHYLIREHHLQSPETVSRISQRLAEIYGAGSYPISLVLHKQTLVEPVLTVLSQMEQFPRLFERARAIVVDHLVADPGITEWIANSPETHEPKITRLSQIARRE